MTDDDYPPLIGFGEQIADRLHEAICEGRRQDAIDLLNELMDGNYRSFTDQRNLFPDRIPA